MECPKCGGEVAYNDTDVETFDIKEVGTPWPVKILCQCNTTHKCNDCNTLITASEMREYTPD